MTKPIQMTEQEELELLELENKNARQAKQNYGQQLAGFFTQDIPKELQTIANQGNRLMGGITDMGIGVPQRTARILSMPFALGGQALSSGGNLAMEAANRIAGGIPGKLAQKYMQSGVAEIPYSVGQAIAGTAPAQAVNMYLAKNPEAAADVQTAIEMSPLIGVKGAGAGAGTLSEMLEKGGTKNLAEIYRVPKAIAQKAGANRYEGTKNTLQWLKDFKVEGTPANASKNIETALSEKKAITDNLLEKFAVKNPDVEINNTNVLQNLWEDVSGGKVPGTKMYTAKERNAVMDRIVNMMSESGYDKNIKVSDLPQIKTDIKNEIGLFSKGATQPETNLAGKIGEEMYDRFKVALEDKIPEIATHNKDIHKLMILKEAANDAATRIGNKYTIGPSDWASLLGAGLLFGKTGKEAIPGLGSVLAIKKMAGGGRLGKAMIGTSRSLSSIANVLGEGKTLGEMLK
jgi:hypothetical protein